MKKKWDELSLEEQAEMMKVAVKNGIYDLYEIRDKYNEFAEGGDIGELEVSNDASINPIPEEMVDDFNGLASPTWQSKIEEIKKRDYNYNVEDFAYRIKKLHPEVTREQVENAYINTPVIASDSRRKGKVMGTYNHGEENGYGRRIMLYPNSVKEFQGIDETGRYSKDAQLGYVYSHENAHNYFDQIYKNKFTDKEASMMEAAFGDIFNREGMSQEEFLNESHSEMVRLRDMLSKAHNNAVKEKLDNVLYNDASDKEIINNWFAPNSGYTQDDNEGTFRKKLLGPDGKPNAERIKLMRDAMFYIAHSPYDSTYSPNVAAFGGPIIEMAREYAKGGNTVGEFVDAIYQNNPKEEYLGEPSHHYDFTQSEEWANAHGYYPDARGHRDDRVKKVSHPSHPSRGTWDRDKFILSDFGMETPNYTLFGLNDGRQDPQATLIYDNGVVLPEFTVTPNGNYIENTYDNIRLHYAKGGKIHIKPENRGKFTRLKKRTGHSASWFKEHGTPAQKKMAVFALNSRKWKHGLGGNLYDDGGILDWFKGLFSFGNEEKTPEPVYRNKPAEKIIIANSGKKYIAYAPKRVSENNSKTKEQSEKLENSMRATIRMDQARNRSNPDYDIPYIPEKSIIINGSTTSTNVLDSLAKYAGEHNRNPQLSQKTIRKRGSYTAPRKISMDEMLGLSTQETKNGAMPYFNFEKGQPSYNRALANSNYLTAFGSIPAEYLVRNYQYNDANIDRNTPPLLDAFRYYAQGDYNSNDHNHKSDVIAAGKEAWSNPKVKEWWETSGKYWYNNEKK